MEARQTNRASSMTSRAKQRKSVSKYQKLKKKKDVYASLHQKPLKENDERNTNKKNVKFPMTLQVINW